jgi:hypothetical protein
MHTSLVVLGLLLLAGCTTSPPPAAQHISCEPVAACPIPDAASSTQLEAALWGCVLELRAQYASCAARAQP